MENINAEPTLNEEELKKRKRLLELAQKELQEKKASGLVKKEQVSDIAELQKKVEESVVTSTPPVVEGPPAVESNTLIQPVVEIRPDQIQAEQPPIEQQVEQVQDDEQLLTNPLINLTSVTSDPQKIEREVKAERVVENYTSGDSTGITEMEIGNETQIDPTAIIPQANTQGEPTENTDSNESNPFLNEEKSTEAIESNTNSVPRQPPALPADNELPSLNKTAQVSQNNEVNPNTQVESEDDDISVVVREEKMPQQIQEVPVKQFEEGVEVDMEKNLSQSLDPETQKLLGDDGELLISDPNVSEKPKNDFNFQYKSKDESGAPISNTPIAAMAGTQAEQRSDVDEDTEMPMAKASGVAPTLPEQPNSTSNIDLTKTNQTTNSIVNNATTNIVEENTTQPIQENKGPDVALAPLLKNLDMVQPNMMSPNVPTKNSELPPLPDKTEIKGEKKKDTVSEVEKAPSSILSPNQVTNNIENNINAASNVNAIKNLTKQVDSKQPNAMEVENKSSNGGILTLIFFLVALLTILLVAYFCFIQTPEEGTIWFTIREIIERWTEPLRNFMK